MVFAGGGDDSWLSLPLCSLAHFVVADMILAATLSLASPPPRPSASPKHAASHTDLCQWEVLLRSDDRELELLGTRGHIARLHWGAWAWVTFGVERLEQSRLTIALYLAECG